MAWIFCWCDGQGRGVAGAGKRTWTVYEETLSLRDILTHLKEIP